MLLEMLAEGPILVADSKLDIPTIHDNFGTETHHLGFGLMQVEGNEYTLRFDAGGAMQRTPTGNGWTKLSIEGQYDGYDLNAVREVLTSWLSEIENPSPWQMTRLTYQKYKAKRIADGVPILNGADGEEHEQLVRVALERGEFIPTEVLADYPYLVPEISEAGESVQHKIRPPANEEVQALTAEAQAEFDRWELALLTGMTNKRDSAFHQALNTITHPDTLRKTLELIPTTDTHRRGLVEKRMAEFCG